MTNEESIIKYYILIAKLKDLIRSGWIKNEIQRKRVESVAEHIYSTENLAIAMYLTYKFYYESIGVKLERVILMLAVHELEEIIIGDIPLYAKIDFNKKEEGHKAVEKILNNLLNSEQIKNLVFEFDERETPDAKFAYHCDKMDCDIQAKLYDEEKCFEPKDLSFSANWLNSDIKHYNDDTNFMKVFEYVKNNKILGETNESK
jgi:5'-deoxynucleotidase YfbR-like HD superfamily hydrolase